MFLIFVAERFAELGGASDLVSVSPAQLPTDVATANGELRKRLGTAVAAFLKEHPGWINMAFKRSQIELNVTVLLSHVPVVYGFCLKLSSDEYGLIEYQPNQAIVQTEGYSVATDISEITGRDVTNGSLKEVPLELPPEHWIPDWRVYLKLPRFIERL